MANGNKIKLFQFIQKVYRPSESNQKNHRLRHTKKWIYRFSVAQFFISSSAYLLFEANSMIEYGMAFFTQTTIAVAFFWEMKSIFGYIGNCEQFIEQRKQSTIIYQDIAKKIEQLTKFVTYAIFGAIIILVVSPLLYAIINYYILNSGKDSFLLFFRAWSPFDWKNPFGYLLAWLGQCAGVGSITINVILFYDVIFGLNWLFIVIADDITNDAIAFNNTVETLTNENKTNHAELLERFRDLIQQYMGAKQLINDFNSMCKYLIFLFFSWIMLAITSLLVALQFQLWDDDSKLLEIMILTFVIIWIFGLDLMVCESGQRVTNQFDLFNVEIGRCNWNKLPIEVQRIYVIFLSDTQLSKNIRAYGGIMCTRETFKNVTTKGFQYFMTLRRFRA